MHLFSLGLDLKEKSTACLFASCSISSTKVNVEIFFNMQFYFPVSSSEFSQCIWPLMYNYETCLCLARFAKHVSKVCLRK